MVSLHRGRNKETKVVLTPNRSMGWRGNVRVIMGLSLAIAISVTPIVVMGGWVVVPFALLQIVALTIGLYITLKKLSYHEIITVQGDFLSLKRGVDTKELCSSFPKGSVNILVEEHSHAMTAPDIDMIAEGHCYALGDFLNRADRFKLERILKNQLNLRISHLNSFHRVSF